MIRLALILYAVIGTTLAGTLMVVALTAGYTTTQPIVWAAALGFLLGIPAAYIVARGIADRG